jgi:hypothetical protein
MVCGTPPPSFNKFVLRSRRGRSGFDSPYPVLCMMSPVFFFQLANNRSSFPQIRRVVPDSMQQRFWSTSCVDHYDLWSSLERSHSNRFVPTVISRIWCAAHRLSHYIVSAVTKRQTGVRLPVSEFGLTQSFSPNSQKIDYLSVDSGGP